MSPKITSEQRAALVAHQPGRPVQVVDEETDRVFWLVSPEDVPTLWAEHLDREVLLGVEAINRGELVSWNPDAMKVLAQKAARASADQR